MVPPQQNQLHRQTSFIEPPDGGLAAWLKVLGCFIVFIDTWGIATSFGVYQTHYQLHTLRSYSPSTISWIGTIQVFLMGFTAIFAGPLYDRGYVRSLLCVGCGLVVFGLFMLSLSHSFYQIVLTQSVCIGIGDGLIYVPAVTIVSTTFSTKRPIATGFAATGSAVGGIVIPIMFRELTPIVGLGWFNRILAFTILVISAVAIALLWPGSQAVPRRSRFIDISALKEPAYVFLCGGLFFVELGFWIPPFIITPYAKLSLGTSTDFAFYLLAIMNAGGVVGRIIPAYIASIKKVGPAWVLVVGVVGLGVSILSWLAVRDAVGITIWAVFVGFMSGIAVSVPNAVVVKLSPFTSVVGARSGMMWMFVAFAALIGAPLAGILVDNKTNNYKRGQLFSGMSICVGAAMLCVPAVHVTRKRLD